MLLFETLLLASLSTATPVANPANAAPASAPSASPASASPAPAAPARAAAPSWLSRLLSLRGAWKLQLFIPCSSLSGGTAPCASPLPGLGQVERVPPGGTYTIGWKLPRGNAFRSQGGFAHLDVLSSPALRLGPELSWSTPDSPREDLLKTRLLSPGWGLRVAWGESNLAVGVSACSRLLMVGRALPLVDPFTSEARVELRLP